MPKWWLQTKVTIYETNDDWWCELSTRSEITTSLIFDLLKAQLVGKFSIDWKIVHFFNEDGFECIGRREKCMCLCLEGLQWVTRPLGRNCRGNLEVFLLRKLILWEQPDLHIIISVDFLLLQNIWVHFLFFSWDDLTSISGYGQQASLARFWLRMAGSTEFHKTQKMLTLWQELE